MNFFEDVICSIQMQFLLHVYKDCFSQNLFMIYHQQLLLEPFQPLKTQWANNESADFITRQILRLLRVTTIHFRYSLPHIHFIVISLHPSQIKTHATCFICLLSATISTKTIKVSLVKTRK